MQRSREMFISIDKAYKLTRVQRGKTHQLISVSFKRSSVYCVCMCVWFLMKREVEGTEYCMSIVCVCFPVSIGLKDTSEEKGGI